MLSPRWRKVLRDLASNRTRTLLVVISIAVGVFAIGMVGGARTILTRDLSETWMAVNPASATLDADSFGDDLVQVIRRMPGVADAEARRTLVVRVKVGPDQWQNLRLFAVPDFHDMRIYTVRRLSGDWPPKQHALLLERAALGFLSARAGQPILIELPNGKQYSMPVGGVVHDPGQCPPALCSTGYGYITLDTAEWLGQPRDFNRVNIVVAEQRLDRAHIQAVARQVQDKIEKSGRKVFSTDIPDPGKHPVDSFIQALILLLGVIGFFALLLSGFLVINTIGALLTQQTRQIGVMKSIGARGRDIVGMYLVTVLAFGLLSLFVAIPLGVAGAWALSSFFAGLFNFDISTVSVPPGVLALQVLAGLLVPLLAALVPVISGTRLTIREAIGGYGLGKGRFGRGRIDKLLERVRFLSRPLLLSLRNTFRRKGRLALTLTTLTIAGVIFISVMSVRASLNLTLDNIFAYYDFDVSVNMARPYRTAALDDVLNVPGVTGVEYWGRYGARRLLEGDRASTTELSIVSLPADTKVFNPKLRDGRWLLPADALAVVVNTELLKKEPDVHLGDDLRLKVDGKTVTLRVVGVADILFDQPSVYVNQPAFDPVVGQVGKASQAQLLTNRHDGATQAQVAAAVEERFKRAGLQVASTQTIAKIRENSSLGINIVVLFLLIMAVLLAVVGGLGLMGTMSINVLERTREIGVMRAIGATDGAVQQIVIVEGVLIGLISWAIGALLALPMSKLINGAVGQVFEAPGLSYTFPASGVLLWLGIVVSLAALASFLPAWSASRVTVRDVLAYE
jgi:putative ABC transport system permease protein